MISFLQDTNQGFCLLKVESRGSDWSVKGSGVKGLEEEEYPFFFPRHGSKGGAELVDSKLKQGFIVITKTCFAREGEQCTYWQIADLLQAFQLPLECVVKSLKNVLKYGHVMF